MMKRSISGAAGLAATLLLTLALSPALAATVSVAQGQLSGVTLKNAEAFLGIPYASPPVGELRWRPPVPASSWTADFKADKQPASCVQVMNPPEGRGPWTPEFLIPKNGPMSEDCLYLDIWTPKNAIGKRLPVYVWIHGGGLVEGSASVPIYDGANLAANGNIIVVAINYRLGPFGFLAHPELTAESGTSGNYGLMDQVEALRWLGANVQSLGGDPANITISGQSAGAGSVLSLIGAPSAKGLFARAVIESGPAVAPRAGPFREAQANGVAFMKSAGANSIADLRRMPADALLKAGVDYRARTRVPFGEVIDGRFLPQEPLLAQAFTADFYDTPILAGFNANENSGFDESYGSWTRAQIDQQIAEFMSVADRAKALYLPSGNEDLASVGKQLALDRSLGTMYLYGKNRAQHSGQPMFFYNFVYAEPGPNSARYGAFHTGEVSYVFQNLNAANRSFGPDDDKVSKLLSGYWLNFIRTGNPNGAGLPAWPAFNTTSEQMMRIGTSAAPIRVLPQEKIDLFEARFRLGGHMRPYN